MTENPPVYYRIWGQDNIIYGPFEIPEVVKWIKRGRLRLDDWVFREDTREWHRSRDFAELQSIFKTRSADATSAAASSSGLDPAALRRVKILADLTEEQVASLIEYTEVITLLPHKAVFSQGEHGDAMFLVLDGEVRARLLVQGRESILATFGVGECFGEVAILDEGPRSADVITNQDCVLVKVSASALRRIFAEAPALAAPLLLGLGRTVVSRLRRINQRYHDSVQLFRVLPP